MALADIFQSIPWDHPLVQQGMTHVARRLAGADEASMAQAREKRLDDLFARQDALLDRYARAAPPGAVVAAKVKVAEAAPPAAVATPVPAEPTDLGPILARLTEAGASVDEALRFVREDGAQHPEAVRRLARAQEDLVMLERVDLRPSVLAGLPEGQRRVAEANMQALREARQALHNAPDGGPPTAESIGVASARLEAVTTQLRVAKAVTMAPTAAEPYSRYAPDMDVSVGCLPCGRAHLAGTVGAMRGVTALAQERGMADPQVQAGLLAANKELVALWADDWTEEKVAASPPEDREIMEEAIPRLRAAQARLEAASTPEDVAAVTEELVATREVFMARDLGRGQAAVPSMIVKALPVGPGTHRVDRPDWLYSPPTPLDVAATTVPTDTARAFDSLVGALAQRGVKVRIRNLWANGESVTEGAFNPDTRTIVMAPAALAKDAYSVQVLSHEAAHALRDVPPCHLYNEANVAYEDRDEEALARDVSVVALVKAGLPIELMNGYELEPGEREIDYSLLQSELPEAAYAALLWEAQWVSDALQGAPRDYAAQECPPTTLAEVDA